MAQVLPFQPKNLGAQLVPGSYPLGVDASYSLSKGASRERDIFSGKVPYDPVADYHGAKEGIQSAVEDLGKSKLLGILSREKSIRKSLEEVMDEAMRRTEEDILKYALANYEDLDMQTLIPAALAILLNNSRESYHQSPLAETFGNNLGEEFFRGMRSVLYVVLNDPEIQIGIAYNDLGLLGSKVSNLIDRFEKYKVPTQALDELIASYRPPQYEQQLLAA